MIGMNDRRRFIRDSTLLLTLPLLQAKAAAYAVKVGPDKEPYRTIVLVCDDVFAPDQDIPGARRLNTSSYLYGVMHDDRIDEEEKAFLVNGVTWLDEESTAMFKRPYYRLDPTQRQRVLDAVLEYRWGDGWVYTVMSYLFESMFCDPLYGANTDMSGWRWLAYEPGFPRPKKLLL
jgi:gluconate 2-dehydrogenase gamma chain